MRYEDEIREAQRYFEDVGAEATTGEQLELAERLIASKTATFDPGKFKDHYQAALRELVAAKLRGRLASKETAEPVGGAKIISLMDALKRSLKTDEARKPGRSPSRDGKSPAKRRHAAATRRRRKSA